MPRRSLIKEGPDPVVLLLWRNNSTPDRYGDERALPEDLDDIRGDSALYEDDLRGNRQRTHTRGSCSRRDSFDISQPPAVRGFAQLSYRPGGGEILQPTYEAGPSTYGVCGYKTAVSPQHDPPTYVYGGYRYPVASAALSGEHGTLRSPGDGNFGVRALRTGSKQIDTLEGILERARADVGALFAARVSQRFICQARSLLIWPGKVPLDA